MNLETLFSEYPYIVSYNLLLKVAGCRAVKSTVVFDETFYPPSFGFVITTGETFLPTSTLHKADRPVT